MNWLNENMEDKILTPTQFEIKNNSNMCCGIAYGVVKYKNILLHHYLSSNFDEYVNIFIKIMLYASNRKLNNPEINYDGEYINDITIRNDFTDIYESMTFCELLVGSISEDNEKHIEKIKSILHNAKILDSIIMCKEANVFVIIKLNGLFMMIDSHLPIHGKINSHNIMMWILSGGYFNGIISIGYVNRESQNS